MTFVKSLKCRSCESIYPVEAINVCDLCFGPLEVDYDYDAIAKVVTRDSIEKGPLSMWRYENFLPVDFNGAVDLNAGFTPMIKAKNLGEMLGLDNLYLKNDSVNPSFSFKDRVVAVASTKAIELGFDTLACASTGNLAGSVAAHAARAGMKGVVFIPADLEAGKLIGASIYGCTLVAVDGSYDDVNRLCSEIADNYRWAFVNVNLRPFYAEGSKTLGYETIEQLGWKLPDHAIVPAASGELYTKIWRGFNEMAELDLVEGPVKTNMHIAQARGCSPIVEAFLAKESQVTPVKPNTIARSLAIGNPAAGAFALKVAKDSYGTATAVPEPEVAAGMKLLAETEGIFTETAGGVVISCLKRLAEQKAISKADVTVVYITGNGLKTQEVVENVVSPIRISPTFDSFETTLGNLNIL